MHYYYASIATVYIGIGSNVHPKQNIGSASVLIRKNWPVIKFSSVYKSAAQGYENQDDFLNAVAKIETDESPEEVHRILCSIEQELGKDIEFKNGPRTIDLDLLLYNNLKSDINYKLQTTNYKLTIPHPRMHERRFVLEPLCELSNDTRWHDLLKKTLDQSCKKVNITL